MSPAGRWVLASPCSPRAPPAAEVGTAAATRPPPALAASAYHTFRPTASGSRQCASSATRGRARAAKPDPAVNEHCNRGCDVPDLHVTPGSAATWLISVNTATGMPELLEKQMPGRRLGHALSGWVEVAGPEAPHPVRRPRRQRVRDRGMRIGEPDDRLFIPSVTE